MENVTAKPETELIYDDLHFVQCVYKNRTRCRLNVYGLKNSNRFAKYLTVRLRSQQGLYNIKPSIITGNLLITFDPQNTNHKVIFSQLQKVVSDFIRDEPLAVNNGNIISSLNKDDRRSSLYSTEKRTSLKYNQYYKRDADHKDEMFNKVSSVVLKTGVTILIQHFTKRIMLKYLLRLGV